jgi:hypothetical protein
MEDLKSLYELIPIEVCLNNFFEDDSVFFEYFCKNSIGMWGLEKRIDSSGETRYFYLLNDIIYENFISQDGKTKKFLCHPRSEATSFILSQSNIK